LEPSLFNSSALFSRRDASASLRRREGSDDDSGVGVGNEGWKEGEREGSAVVARSKDGDEDGGTDCSTGTMTAFDDDDEEEDEEERSE
jgi:hypothetical protein